MAESDLWKNISSIINGAFSQVPPTWRGPILVLLIVLIGGLTFYYITLMPSKASKGNSTTQISHGDDSPNINNNGGTVTIKK